MNFSKKIVGLFLGQIVFTLILFFFNPEGLNYEAKCILASTMWMAIWWVTECVPIAVTALLPIVLFPLSGGLDLQSTTASYGHKLVFLFVGGFIIALAIEKWNLHKRLALNIIRLTGSKKSKVILGFMIATAFLSMWISNTATSIMILPVGLAIIAQLKDDPNTIENENVVFGKSIMIAIAYSASIGGMATLIGTPPNMIFAGVVEQSYGIKISMFDWMKFAIPISATLLIICWLYLTKVAYKFPNEEFSEGRKEILNQIKLLGKFSYEESRVLIVFALTAIAWILRGFLETIIPAIDDTIIAISFAVILFIIPIGFKNISALDYEMNSVIDGFGWSMGLSLNEDRIYVSDGLHNQILVFDKLENIFLDRISLEEKSCTGHIHGMEIKNQKIFIVKQNQNCIPIFDLNIYII